MAELELRHRQRARADDRVRAARTTGLRNLPLHDTAQNQIWLEIWLEMSMGVRISPGHTTLPRTP